MAQREAQKFQEILNGYVNQYLNDHPHRATEAGFHEYDQFMPAFTREHVTGHIEGVKQTLNELAALDTKRLKPDIFYDYQIFENVIRGEILELTEVRGWMRNPNLYNDLITNTVVALTDFHFASPDERLKSVIARLDKVPDILAAMQANVENPAPVYIDVAKEQFTGTAAFLRNDLPKAFAEAQNAELKEKLKASIERASKAYDEAIQYISTQLNKKARGGYSLGQKFFQQKIFYEEMVDTPIADLVKMGEEELKRTQQQMADVAKKIDPGRSLAQVLDGMAKDHATAEELVTAATAVTEDLRKFMTEKNIATIPADVVPKVRALQPFAQPLLFARMDSPGPFEQTTESYYTITLPDPRWSAARKEQHLQLLNRSIVPILSIHETYPGHYLQFLYARRAPSKVRKLFGSEAFREGWAHYVEQMMLDEGYGNNDPKLRLAQLQFSALRATRYVVAIRLHGQGAITHEEAVNFFMKEAYLSKENAEREARRGALDSSYLSYTLGKLEILRLREDYKKAKGAEFTLKDFHDNLLKHGYPPMKIIRQILLPESGQKRAS